MMSTEEEECEESVCQSVLLFACKGVIEGIIVLLFLWLFVQVLFTKQLEVHLQVLLSVGLVFLCLTLILGCVICWYKARHKPAVNKQNVTSPAPPDSARHLTVDFSPSPSSGTTLTKLQYEELDGEDVSSVFDSSMRSDDTFTSAVSEVKHKVCFQMRRLSSPTISASLYRPMTSRSSLPSFPRLGLLSKTRKLVESHCAAVGDEHRRLTVPSSAPPDTLSSLQTPHAQGEDALFPNYGSNSVIETSFLHFNATFSSSRNTLTVTVVGITGKIQSLDEVTIHVRLPPLCPEPLDVQDQSRDVVVNVNSVELLKDCTLRLSVSSQDHTETSPLGEAEVCCGDLDWISERPISCVRELKRKS